MKKLFVRKTEFSITKIFFRFLIALASTAVLIVIVYSSKMPYLGEFREGDVALRNIYAPYDFLYEADINEELTKAKKDEAAKAVLEVHDITTEFSTRAKEKVKLLFEKAVDIQKLPQIQEEEKLNKLKEVSPIQIPDTSLKTLLQIDSPETLQNKIFNIIDQFAQTAILTTQEKERLQKSDKSTVTLRNLKAQTEEITSVDKLNTLDGVKRQLNEKVSAELGPEDKKSKILAVDILEHVLEPNTIYNLQETESGRQAVIKLVAPQYNKIEVKKDEIIIAKGQRLSRQHLAQLDAIHKKHTRTSGPLYALGITVLIIMFVITMSLYLRYFKPNIFASNSQLLLLAALVILTVLICEFISFSPLPTYFMPVASFSMLSAILLDANLALIATAMISLVASIIAGNNLNIIFVGIIGGVVGIYAVRGIRRRIQLLKAGFIAGLANFVCIIGIGILNNLGLEVILKDGLWGIGSGLFSTGIVMIALPVFEFYFKITTDISLLELADLNHPLFKELIIKAPGTYHHSLVVGQLAETACDAIGANSLLARVGAYYHDIGKMEKAEYFTENQIELESRHDKLSPGTSSLIITNHTKEGVELARKYKLPQSIIDFIEQHHGTGLIYYFYQKALEELEDEEQLKEEGFRYQGPKPQTAETAIVLLADSVEAASRSLDSHMPAKLTEMVRRIINNKFIDGQLDECDLTLKDLHRIADSFVRVLAGIYHSRVEYPNQEEAKTET